MHRHFPHVVDCRPIPIDSILLDAGWRVVQQRRTSVATLPVAALVARPG